MMAVLDNAHLHRWSKVCTLNSGPGPTIIGKIMNSYSHFKTPGLQILHGVQLVNLNRRVSSSVIYKGNFQLT